MTKEQNTLYKLLLQKVGTLLKCSTFDDYMNAHEKEPRIVMSDATYEAMQALFDTYRAIDYENHKNQINAGLFEAVTCIGDTND
jgi:hypothetical protein